MKKFLEKIGNFLVECFNAFWDTMDKGWRFYRAFVLILTLFYIAEFLFLESNKLFYFILLVFHTTANFIVLPWFYMRNEVKHLKLTQQYKNKETYARKFMESYNTGSGSQNKNGKG